MKNYITLPDADDIVFLDDDSANKLYSLWCGSGKNRIEAYRLPNDNYFHDIYIPVVPFDLMLARTVPMPHFRITHNANWPLRDLGEDGMTFTINTIFPEESGGEYEVHARNDYYGFIYFIKEDERGIKWESYFVPNLGNRAWTVEHQNKINAYAEWWYYDDKTRQAMETMRAIILADWYAIQLSLLHPTLQTVFFNPVKEKEYSRQGVGKNRKRITKYVRKHYITAEGIDEALYGHGHRDFERKTMAWYVIGHWRQYKNGTRKFINGYWKGPLREMKRNLDGGRIRELAV